MEHHTRDRGAVLHFASCSWEALCEGGACVIKYMGADLLSRRIIQFGHAPTSKEACSLLVDVMLQILRARFPGQWVMRSMSPESADHLFFSFQADASVVMGNVRVIR